MKECSECKWWRKINSAVGECRRMPPQPADNMQDPRWWPATHRDDWCGEFKAPKPKTFNAGTF